MPLHMVPFDAESGQMLDGVYSWKKDEDIEWRPNVPFEASLTLVSWYSDRPKFYFADEAGVKYPVFMSEFMKLVENTVINAGVTERLRWTAVKRGSAYGIMAILDA